MMIAHSNAHSSVFTRSIGFGFLMLAIFTGNTIQADDIVSVATWQPHDFVFTSKAAVDNPFQTELTGMVTGPDGTSFTMPGFFDGKDTWKIRVAPTAEGNWTLTTKSKVAELDGQTVAFSCVKNANANIHGVLQVDKAHPHHFIFADGTRFFMQAYEYDWLWALDMDKPDVPTVEESLDLISRFGFNYVILNTYAHDTKWRHGTSGPDDFGPPALYPWAGSNESPDHSRMNLEYWQHYDRVMTALLQRGIQAHVFIKVYNKAVTWPERDSPEEQLFLRWLLARYAAYPNVIWDFSKEAHNEKNLAYKQGVLKYIRDTDPYDHLVTVHDDDAANDSGAYDKLTDFRTDQHHGNSSKNNKNSNRIGSNHDKVLAQRHRKDWPVANVESDYECGPGGLNDKTFGGAMTADATIRTLWDIAMAGGYTGYYYTYTAWDVVRPLDQPQGYTYMKHFGEFWRGTEYWKLEPSDQLVSEGYCLANPGQEYVAYQSKAQSFTLNIAGSSATLLGEWFNPLSGERTPAGPIENGRSTINPPDDWGDAPIVFHASATPEAKK